MKKEATKQQKAAPKTAVTREENNAKVRKLTLAAMLTAIVVVLALLGTAIHIPGTMFSINLSLVPIVIGAALLGPLYGAWFGFVSAVVILISGDAAPFMTINVFGTFVTVLLKGVLSGLCAGLVYHKVKKWNSYAAIVAAALVCPVVNTGIFLLGCLIFFWPTITTWAEGLGYKSAGSYAILGLAGLNFVIELVINIVLAPIIARILGQAKDKDAAEIVYGVCIFVVGCGALLAALIFLRKGYIGTIPASWGIQRPALRFAIMALLSNLVQICGVVLLVMGMTRKKTKQSIEKKQKKALR